MLFSSIIQSNILEDGAKSAHMLCSQHTPVMSRYKWISCSTRKL